MSLVGRDLVIIGDLSDAEVEGLFAAADDMHRFARSNARLCQGKVMAALFHEPSTRTRMSFESAMLRLGGGVISCADAASSSAAKGESLADMVRVIEGYADVIVLRHPLEGAARVAADYAKVPIINGGDGAHEHPTQTLLDLYTIRSEHGRLAGVKVALCGDLKHGRTVHSLAVALARFGGEMVFVSPQGLEMPEDVVGRLQREHSITPPAYHRLDNLGDGLRELDVIYATRVQKERFALPEAYEAAKEGYQTTAALLDRVGPRTLFMHPLPRVDELDYALDVDHRAAYFRQAANGVVVRMALVAAVLGSIDIAAPPSAPAPEVTVSAECTNPRCVMAHEPYLPARFLGDGDTVRCRYCEREVTATA